MTLKNPRHERFAQALASGKTADEAYVAAGFKANRGNASRLKANERIEKRVQQILESAGRRVEITQSRVLAELAKIGFADIRKIVNWHSQTNVAMVDTDADMEALVDEGEIRFTVANQVELVSSDKIDDDTAAAIAEVSMTGQGALKVKLHDKRGALVDIGRHLGMFKDRVEHTGLDGGPIQTEDVSARDTILSRIAGLAERSGATNGSGKPH